MLRCLRFYSRLPVPAFGFERAPHAMLDFRRGARWLPLAGALIALPAALVLAALAAAGLPASFVAALTLAASMLTTGAFHEDGLADTADGFGGGRTRERKLEIMRDSRIGTFGGAALVVSILARAAALAALLDRSGALAAAGALIMLGAVARTAALAPLALLDPARTDGAMWAAMKPSPATLAIGFVLSAAISLGLAQLVGLSATATLVALLAALAASLAMTQIARRQIGGATGDVAGAAEQLAEIAMLAALLAPALQ
ncbi:MAG: adenosylcobinamide-GDP ribazoletransferase [Rhizobiales bacterium]|nr:adenosylcobinamide-GDP ribazoletransferase [Hyphomicrobiales bacterium]